MVTRKNINGWEVREPGARGYWRVFAPWGQLVFEADTEAEAEGQARYYAAEGEAS